MKTKTKKKFKSRCQSCNCKVNPKLHSCPYQGDIKGNDEPYCNCCVDCQNECASDI